VRAGIAVKPAEYTWRQLAGAGALAGIGFTMSLFIAGQAFVSTPDFSAAKIAVFAASIVSAVVGTALLWGASPQDLSKRRSAPARKYRSPPALQDREQEVFR
jgi:Na+:H+ antiporter, NhaA family